MKIREDSGNKYDVVIVGAGPAGCSTAHFLSKSYKVLLIDWSNFPRDKPCGGLLVPESQNFVKKLKMPKHIFSYPKHLELKLYDWNNNIEMKEKRIFWNVSRRSFDYWLLDISENKVDFTSETKLLEFEKKDSEINILTEKNNEKKIISTKYLIGANGAFSNIRKNIKSQSIKYYVAVQTWIKTKYIGNDVYFIFDNEITDFYSWVIPKGGYLVIGSALQNNVEKKFKLFEKKLKEQLGIEGPSFKRESAIGLRPGCRDEITLGEGNILLVGEAAGLISPSTGEGISFALRSGYNCAKALNENFKNALNNYKNLCEPLIIEIEDKIKKAEILSDPKKRIETFERMKK